MLSCIKAFDPVMDVLWIGGGGRGGQNESSGELGKLIMKPADIMMAQQERYVPSCFVIQLQGDAPCVAVSYWNNIVRAWFVR